VAKPRDTRRRDAIPAEDSRVAATESGAGSTLEGPDDPQLTKRARVSGAVGRIFKTALLLLVIAAVVASTTLLDRSDQVFLLKVFLVVFLSVLPGWLFLLFISVKGTGLYDEYVLNLYRLRIDSLENLPKPPPSSSYWTNWHQATKHLSDRDAARNIYLKKFEAAYGRGAVPESRRRRQRDDNLPDPKHARQARLIQRIGVDAFSPIILLTALFAVGWTIFVQPELARDISVFVSLPLSGLPDLPEDVLRLGFLGSYAFVTQSLVRRYFQMDLRNHAYVSAIARVILVAALILAIHPIWALIGAPEELELAFAFLLGFFPEMGFRLLRKRVSSIVRSEETPEERYPLQQLDGLTIWGQARLMEEGIEDMQNLTTANLVDLMLYTRMPIARLVDWIDQGFLYLRVPAHDSKGKCDRPKLRGVGIRSATDLLDAYEAGTKHDSEFLAALKRMLNTDNQGHDDGGPSAIEGLRRALEGEVNLWHVRKWKSHTWLESPSTSGNGRDSSTEEEVRESLTTPAK
jgi:hypothetical protein